MNDRVSIIFIMKSTQSGVFLFNALLYNLSCIVTLCLELLYIMIKCYPREGGGACNEFQKSLLYLHCSGRYVTIYVELISFMYYNNCIFAFSLTLFNLKPFCFTVDKNKTISLLDGLINGI